MKFFLDTIDTAETRLLGAHVVTPPPAVRHQLFNYPLADRGLAAFLADFLAGWANPGQQIA